MSQIYELYLRVKEADEADYDRSIIRIHKKEKPTGLNWGEEINVSLDKKNWVNCTLEPAGDTGMGRIYIGIHMKRLINKDNYGNAIAKVGMPSNFYIRKASKQREFVYISAGILIIAAVAVYFLLLR